MNFCILLETRQSVLEQDAVFYTGRYLGKNKLYVKRGRDYRKGRSLLTSCIVRVLLELMQFVTAKAAKKLSGCTNGGEKSGNKRDFYN